MAAYTVRVTEWDRLACELQAELIPLEYPELAARAESNMAMAPTGDIWAAVGGTGPERCARMFCSKDGGRTWTSRTIQPTEKMGLVAFTVLRDNTMLLVVAGRSRTEVYASDNEGESWEKVAELLPDPYDQIGVDSATELSDRTILFPVCRYNEAAEREPREFPHYVFRSTDKGRTWEGGGPIDRNTKPVGTGPKEQWPGQGGTFPGCLETHILERSENNLLAAFRYSGFPRPWHEDMLEKWGGNTPPDGIGRYFKHVFLGDSTHGGRTWQNLRPLLDAEGRPVLEFGQCHGQSVKVPDGRVVLVHDNRYPYTNTETIARVSRDDGQTWLPDAYHLSEGSSYPSSVVLEDGTIVTVVGSTRLDSAAQPIEPWSAKVVRWRLP